MIDKDLIEAKFDIIEKNLKLKVEVIKPVLVEFLEEDAL